MLNRRHLRIKVFQAVYAFLRGAKNDLGVGERELISGIDRIYELFILHVSIFVELKHFSERLIDERKRKRLPTQEDLNPNLKFIQNPLLVQFDQNHDLQKLMKDHAANWADEADNIKKLFTTIEQSEVYTEYMNSSNDDYEFHRDFLVKLYKLYIADNEFFQHVFEERSIHWVDDHYFVCGYVVKFLKEYKSKYNENSKVPALFKDIEDDMQFIKVLYRQTILNSKEYEKMIMEKAKNWEADRIAAVDFIFMKMALAELLKLPSVPVKVTLNEYIELSKLYSTPKSKLFINGVLDKIVPELKANGTLQKVGRGLME